MLRITVLCALVSVGAAFAAFAADVPWLAEVQQPPAEIPEIALSPLVSAPLTRDSWLAERPRLIAAWREFLGPMPARPAESRWTVLRTDRLPDVTRELIEYEGEPGLKVQAYLLRPNEPAASRSRAGLVALHPTTADSIEPIAGVKGEDWQHTALKLARRGFVVICPRCFLWQDAKSLNDAVEQHYARHPQTLGMAKMLYDAERALDILAAQPDVDPQRIGAYGHSLGAKETLYLAAFDDRIKAAVASEGGIGFASTNWDAAWYLGPAIKQPGFSRNHHELIALIAPRPFLILGGESGPGAADGARSWPYVAAALPVYRTFGEPARLGLLNHHRGHLLDDAMLGKLAEWLEAGLDQK
jgi:dienelactone hydrolase